MSQSDDQTNTDLSADKPLEVGSASSEDRLHRGSYARSVVRVLRTVSHSTGFTVSVEGAWGSGKTSVFAMVEEMLLAEASPIPIIVHFNPWLVGERDAMLRMLLVQIAQAVGREDQTGNARTVTESIRAYSGVFDVLKLIPGAEPWASIVKTVLHAVGKATGDIAEFKEPELERRKRELEDALKAFNRPIVVFIDDIDRLFPNEVVEMVRIVKAVGDLPNVGYVVAWDSEYITGALHSAAVPMSSAYIDKIVQFRTHVPRPSRQAMGELFESYLKLLEPDAFTQALTRDDEDLARLAQSGLSDLLETPRDALRLVNTAMTLEPDLRGEVTIADILGLAGLMTRAQPVYALLVDMPQMFSREYGVTDVGGKEGRDERDRNAIENAIARCPNPNAAARLTAFLFPAAPIDTGLFNWGNHREGHGHLAGHGSLMFALQRHLSDAEVSIVAARSLLTISSERREVLMSLKPENWCDFFEQVISLLESKIARDIPDPIGLARELSRFPDTSLVIKRGDRSPSMLRIKAPIVVEKALWAVAMAVPDFCGKRFFAEIAIDPEAFTMAWKITANSESEGSTDQNYRVDLDQTSKEMVRVTMLDLLRDGRLYETFQPEYCLRQAPRVMHDVCADILATAKEHDPTLDIFMTHLLISGLDSNKGTYLSLKDSQDIVASYFPEGTPIAHASERLKSQSLNREARSAWEALLSGKKTYLVDGSQVLH